MASIRTPSNLELLLHCHYSNARHPRLDAPAVSEGVAFLLDHHMIELADETGIYRTTVKGDFYIKHLLTIPFPECTWKIPHYAEPS